MTKPNLENIILKEGDYFLVAFPSKKNDENNCVCVVQEMLKNPEAEVIGMMW